MGCFQRSQYDVSRGMPEALSLELLCELWGCLTTPSYNPHLGPRHVRASLASSLCPQPPPAVPVTEKTATTRSLSTNKDQPPGGHR